MQRLLQNWSQAAAAVYSSKSLGCFLDRKLKDYVLASQLLVGTLEGLDLPLCAVPVLGVKVYLHHQAHTQHREVSLLLCV